ncbi:hypothetical protein [Dactylosporangium sp. CA-139066]|uniref:hypothetical protein n=1 Tax=Dactylosporangium sp. CA-139066 TaxID=3239930 RepID=UPI003D917CD8
MLESGALRVGVGELVENLSFTSRSPEAPVLDLSEAISTVLHAIVLAAEIAEHAGRRGAIGIALGMDGLTGARATPPAGADARRPFEYLAMRDGLAVYDEDFYSALRVATTTELGGDLIGVVDDLLGALLRSLGIGDPLRIDPASRLGTSEG